MTSCDECGNPCIVDHVRGETFCSNCSLVTNETVIDTTPASSNEDAPRPETAHLNSGIQATRIMNERYDARGGVINEATRDKMRNLTWLDNHSTCSKDRSIRRLHNMVVDVGLKLGLPQPLRDRAFYLVKKGYECGVLRNQEFALLVGACFMLAAKESKYNLPPKLLISRLVIARQNPLRQLNRAYRVVKRGLHVDVAMVSPSTLLPTVSVKLKLDRAMCTATDHLLEQMAGGNYHRPEVELGAAIYLADHGLGRKIPQVAIAEACGTTDVSIRSFLNLPKLQILRSG